MTSELVDYDFFQAAAVLALVDGGDSADPGVAAVGEDGADGKGLGTDAGFGGAVNFGDVGVDGGGDDGGGVFLAGSGENHHEHALGFHAGVGADVGFEGAVVGVVVSLFDGGEVGVGAADEDFVEHVFVCAGAGECAVEGPDVLLEGAAEDGEETHFEVAGGFFLDVVLKVAAVALVISLLEGGDFKRGNVDEGIDEHGFVGAHAFHRFAAGVGGAGHVDGSCLTWDIAR